MPGLGGADRELSAAEQNVKDAGQSLYMAKGSIEGVNRHIAAAKKRLVDLNRQGVSPERMTSTILLAAEIEKNNALILAKIMEQVLRLASLYGGIGEMK